MRYGPGVAEWGGDERFAALPPGGRHGERVYASIAVDDRPRPTNGTGGLVAWRSVTPEYFRVLEIPIAEGTGFTEEAAASKGAFVVLSKRLAARMFAGQDPIGHRLRMLTGGTDQISATIVGVANDVKNSGLGVQDQAEYYMLRRNLPEDWSGSLVVAMKTSVPAEVMERWVTAQVAAIDPTVPVSVETLGQRVSKLADRPRFQTMLVSFFALVGLAMALIGLYGVISFLVAQRMQEIGVRMALGAGRYDILRLVMGKSLRLIVAGTVVGLIAARSMSVLLTSMLFGVSPQ